MELAPVDLAACLVCMARSPVKLGSWVKIAPKQKAELKIFVFVLLMVQKSGEPVEVGSLSYCLQGLIDPTSCMI